MRIWDIDPNYLCRKHLLGEHRELHGLWNILTIHEGRGGYSHHPETKRWIGKRKALFNRHEALVLEMKRRGYTHKTPLDEKWADGDEVVTLINTLDEQRQLLKDKPCDCFIVAILNPKK